MIKFTKINQSLVKEIVSKRYDPDIDMFERKDFCPSKIYHTYISGEYRIPPTESQYKGLFFESKLLGATANGNKVLNIPYLKNGNIPVDYERILKQVDAAKVTFLTNQIMVYPSMNCQIPLSYYDENLDIIITAELDIFPTTIMHEGTIKNTIIDLKLTANVHSTYGDYSWGDLTYMDFIQADAYMYLVNAIFSSDENIEICKKLNPNFDYKYIFSFNNVNNIRENGILFHYVVFGYTDSDKFPIQEQKKIIERVWTKDKQYDMIKRFAYATAILKEEEERGWETNPDFNRCKNCPISNRCRDAQIQEKC